MYSECYTFWTKDYARIVDDLMRAYDEAPLQGKVEIAKALGTMLQARTNLILDRDLCRFVEELMNRKEKMNQ